MPSGITEFGGPAWASALFGLGAAIDNYWVGLGSEAPGVDADGTIFTDLEPGDAAYNRQEYPATGASKWALSGTYVTTVDDIDFGVPAADWGLITHYALLTASAAGDIYSFGQFRNPVYVQAGFRLIIPAGGIVIALSNLQDPITL